MGMSTTLKIAEWQKERGIDPATGQHLENLEALSQFAYGLIKVIELEKSGIRDGDGSWHGSDVIGAMCANGTELLNAVLLTNEVLAPEDITIERVVIDDAQEEK